MAHDVIISYASGDKPIADAACSPSQSRWAVGEDHIMGLFVGRLKPNTAEGHRNAKEGTE